jgi:tetratricopeptide (TPR) repeat protein
MRLAASLSNPPDELTPKSEYPTERQAAAAPVRAKPGLLLELRTKNLSLAYFGFSCNDWGLGDSLLDDQHKMRGNRGMRDKWMLLLALAAMAGLSSCAAPPANQLASGCPYSGAYQPTLSQRMALDCEGKYYLKRGKYDHAIKNFDQAIQIDPVHAQSYYNRSLAFRALGKTAQADADLAKARQLDPTIPQT